MQALQNPSVSEECRSAGSEFVCQYSFPLCHCVTGEEYLPSREFCNYVSTQVCSAEWQAAIYFGYVLPDCSELPSTGSTSYFIFAYYCFRHITGDSDNTSNITSNSTIVCSESDGFSFIDGFCRPRCDKFQTHTPKNALIHKVIQLTANIISLSVGIIVLIVSLIRWRVM